jgi:hypothetical protein
LLHLNLAGGRLDWAAEAAEARQSAQPPFAHRDSDVTGGKGARSSSNSVASDASGVASASAAFVKAAARERPNDLAPRRAKQ